MGFTSMLELVEPLLPRSGFHSYQFHLLPNFEGGLWLHWLPGQDDRGG